MRLIGAGLFVFAGLLAAVAVLGSLGILDRAPVWLVALGLVIVLVVLIALAVWLLNRKGIDSFGDKPLEEQTRELEQQGLLESTEYQATRAFGVDEFEDEGISYFIELADGRVLFLSGQYLYDYEPDAAESRPRRFPCSGFSIHRHKADGYVVDIQCRGRVLEPEAVARPFSDRDWTFGRVPDDGEMITTSTYEAIKRERLSW
jgi:hypothetical protein